MTSALPIMVAVLMQQFGGRTELPKDPPEDVAVAVLVDYAPDGSIVRIPTAGWSSLYRIQNLWTGGYLHNETNTNEPRIGDAPEEWWSSYWWVIPSSVSGQYYIINRWTGRYLVSYDGPEYLSYVAGLASADRVQQKSQYMGFKATNFWMEAGSLGGVPCLRIGGTGTSPKFPATASQYLNDEDRSDWPSFNANAPWYWWSACWVFHSYRGW